MNPLCSPIFMIPSQKANTPLNPNEISKAVLDRLNNAVIISENTFVSPNTKSLKVAVTKALIKKKIQMKFSNKVS
jgi:hypothetical protein